MTDRDIWDVVNFSENKSQKKRWEGERIIRSAAGAEMQRG